MKEKGTAKSILLKNILQKDFAIAVYLFKPLSLIGFCLVISALQRDKELCGLSSNFQIHVSVSDLYCIFLHDGSAYSAAGKDVDRCWEYIDRSLTYECGNWD
jgi:hypothetical protein